MELTDLGNTCLIEPLCSGYAAKGFAIGRVVSEHKERYGVKSTTGEYDAEITGNMRYTAQSREDFPAVGDWVAFAPSDDGMGIIHQILPRFSTIKRRAVNAFGEVQLIATNIDTAFLLQAADRDFNINRLERYLVLCNEAKVTPVVVITKTDLITEAELAILKANLTARLTNVAVIALSNLNLSGYDGMNHLIEKGKTYCMLGSSGVGKSSLLNNLMGRTAMKTETISEKHQKGRHTTTHRELVILPNGGLLIDNPGMREVGIADSESGLESTFDRIFTLAKACRYADCSHTTETGCAVLNAVECGELNQSTYENFQRLEREKSHFESTVVEKRKKDKAFGKMMKNYKKENRSSR